MTTLWTSTDPAHWAAMLATYPEVVAAQHVSRLNELDQWYRETFPTTLTSRTPPAITLEELVQITEWKMKRGVWRARNLALVRSNDPALVATLSTAAFTLLPDQRKPLTQLINLAGVGPATASAVLAARQPDVFPFFDELVADQIPGLGKVAFTTGYYHRYAEALRQRATALSSSGAAWTAHAVSQALWAASGGKVAL